MIFLFKHGKYHDNAVALTLKKKPNTTIEKNNATSLETNKPKNQEKKKQPTNQNNQKTDLDWTQDPDQNPSLVYK